MNKMSEKKMQKFIGVSINPSDWNTFQERLEKKHQPISEWFRNIIIKSNEEATECQAMNKKRDEENKVETF